MKIKTGDPLILLDASGLEEHGLYDGMKGWANSISIIPEDKTYIFFMAHDAKEMVVIDSKRVEVDSEAKAAGLELTEATIHKGD